MSSVLTRIITDKQNWLANQQQTQPLSSFQHQITPSERDFYTALASNRPAFILECKKASPSKGLIRPEFDIERIAQSYAPYASVLSVLTDVPYFQGDVRYLNAARRLVTQPILCKDFFIDPYQVYWARYHGADAILLMLSVLDDAQYRQLADIAATLNMGVLTETATSDEFQRAIKLGARVIGVNHRNLHDLSIDLNRLPKLLAEHGAHLPPETLLIAESGIYTHQEVQQLSAYAHGFLVGSSLMAQADLAFAVRALVLGEHKVCGLTRAEDAQAAYAAGALYGGLIFAPHSPRRITLEQAQTLINAAPLGFVGVFQQQSVDEVVEVAKHLRLKAVQLHGEENDAYIDALRAALPAETAIWRAVAVELEDETSIVLPLHPAVARYVLDTKRRGQSGGTGHAFAWQRIPIAHRAQIVLAGGIGVDNVEAALAQGCRALDINSGAESSAGVKDAHRLQQIFQRIHARER